MKTNRGSGAYHIGMFGRPAIFMNPNKDKGGSGGGGNDDDGGDDDLEAKVLPILNKFFHKAFGEREQRQEKKLAKLIETTLGAKLEEISEKLGAAKPKDDEGGDEKPTDKPRGNDGKFSTRLSPEIQAQLDKAAKDAKEAKDLASKYQKEAEEQKARGRKSEEISELTQMLTGSVKPALLNMVVSQLHSNLTRDDESGAILWKGSDGELLPLKDGVESWKKSDAGKEVAPPRSATGAGTSNGGGNTPTKPGEFTLEHLGSMLGG